MDERMAFLQEQDGQVPRQVTFHHEISPGGPVALQYWHRPDGSSDPPDHLILFILGNPGLLDYYIPFLTHLRSLLPASFAIISSSHMGHTPKLSAPAIPLDLPQQLEAKVEVVKCLQAYLKAWSIKNGSRSTPKLSLMGHSVGAWLTCEVMKRVSGIHAGYLLFPTVGWIGQTWNGRTLWPLFRFPVRHVVPTLSYLLRPILPATTFPPTTLSLLRSPETIRHCLDLSVSEMEVIQDPDLEWFSLKAKETGEGKVYGAWSRGNLDGWVGREGAMVRDALGGEQSSRIKVLDGVPHAFCLTQQHSEIVADVVAGWVNGSDRSSSSIATEDVSTLETVVPM